MPEKAEYWTLSNKQVKKLNAKMNLVGMKIFNALKSSGFTLFESPDDWLGLSISKNKNRFQTSICFSLHSETKMTFELKMIRRSLDAKFAPWDTYFIKSYKNLEDFELDLENQIQQIQFIVQQKDL